VKGEFEQVVEIKKFAKWIDSAFTLSEGQALKSVVIKHDSFDFEAKAVDLRDGSPVSIRVVSDETTNTATVTVSTQNIDAAGDII